MTMLDNLSSMMTDTPLPPLRPRPGLGDNLRVALFSPIGRRGWTMVMTLLAVFVASRALSTNPSGPAFAWDKANHAAAFAALAFAGWFSFRETARPLFWISFTLLAFGVAIEIGQMYVPGRSADPLDVFADAVGIVLGLGLASQLARSADRRKRPRPHAVATRPAPG